MPSHLLEISSTGASCQIRLVAPGTMENSELPSGCMGMRSRNVGGERGQKWGTQATDSCSMLAERNGNLWCN